MTYIPNVHVLFSTLWTDKTHAYREVHWLREMVCSMRISPFTLVVFWPVLLISHAGCVQDQAQGDGVAICNDDNYD